MASREEKAKDRIARGLAAYGERLQLALSPESNEADTVAFVRDMVADVLGYDRHLEVSAESLTFGRYADLVVKVGAQAQFVIEVKRVGHRLRERDLDQASAYASTKALQWAVLTNGVSWQCYRVDAPNRERVFEVEVGRGAPQAETVEWFYRLSRDGMKRDQLRVAWEDLQAVHPCKIVTAMLTERALRAIRLELRALTGRPIDDARLRGVLLYDVVRSDVREQLAEECPPAKGGGGAAGAPPGSEGEPITRRKQFRWRLKVEADNAFVLDCQYIPDPGQSFQVSGTRMPPDGDFRPARAKLFDDIHARLKPLFPGVAESLVRARAWAGVHKVYPAEQYGRD